MARYEQVGRVLAITTPISFASLFFIGIVGNILVAYVTLSPTSNRFTTRPIHSVLVLNLAAADLVYLLSSLPYQVSILVCVVGRREGDVGAEFFFPKLDQSHNEVEQIQIKLHANKGDFLDSYLHHDGRIASPPIGNCVECFPKDTMTKRPSRVFNLQLLNQHPALYKP